MCKGPVRVYLDSPMAIKVDGVFRHHPEAYKAVASRPRRAVRSSSRRAVWQREGVSSATCTSISATRRRRSSFRGIKCTERLRDLSLTAHSPIRILGDQLEVCAKNRSSLRLHRNCRGARNNDFALNRGHGPSQTNLRSPIEAIVRDLPGASVIVHPSGRS